MSLDGVIEEVRGTVLGCEVWLFGVAGDGGG